MAYSEELATRVRVILARRRGIAEKKMFGGICFLLRGKMVGGVLGDSLIIRADPEESERLLNIAGVRLMDFTGKPMQGILYVEKRAYSKVGALEKWVNQTFAYAASLPEKKPKKRQSRAAK